MKSCTHLLYLCGWILAVGCAVAAAEGPRTTSEATRAQLEEKFAEILRAAGPVKYHGTTAASVELASLQRQRRFFQQLQAERLEGKWVAALISEEPRIHARFETWKGLADYLSDHEALVEVWAYSVQADSAGPVSPRRLTAREIGALKKQDHEQPTFVTATFKEASGDAKKYRIEWGLRAAEKMAAAEAGYARFREMQLSARKALGARGEHGRITSQTQWQALNKATTKAR